MILTAFKNGFSIYEALKALQDTEAPLDTNSLYIADYDMPELHIFSTFHKAKKYLIDSKDIPTETNQYRFVMPAGRINADKAGRDIKTEEGQIILPRWTRLECNDATYIEVPVSAEAELADLSKSGTGALFSCYISGGQIQNLQISGKVISVFNSVINRVDMNTGALYLSDCVLAMKSTAGLSEFLSPTILYITGTTIDTTDGDAPRIFFDSSLSDCAFLNSTMSAIVSSKDQTKTITLSNSELTLFPDKGIIEQRYNIELNSSKLSFDETTTTAKILGTIQGKDGYLMLNGLVDVYGKITHDVSIHSGELRLQSTSESTISRIENTGITALSGSKLNSPLIREIHLTVQKEWVEKRQINMEVVVTSGTPMQLHEVTVYNKTTKMFESVDISGTLINFSILKEAEQLIIWYK